MGRGKSGSSVRLIGAALNILTEIQPASVRAVCYRLFTLGVIDSMSKSNTNRVSTQLVWARENGIIPWAYIVDESREAERPGTWSDPAEFAEAAKRSFRRDAWQQQQVRIEVWSEKGTVRGNAWYNDFKSEFIGTINPKTGVIKEYKLPRKAGVPPWIKQHVHGR